MSAVVVGMGEAFGGDFSSASSDPGSRALFDERLDFYRRLVDASPEVRVVMFVDRPEHAAAARRALGDAPNLSVIARPSWVWMRDFAPLTASLANGARALVAYTPYQLEVNRAIARELGLPLMQGSVSASTTIEGGNVLVDDEGRCYTAVWSMDPAVDPKAAAEVRDLSTICTAVRTVPRMPYETTGHIDIFARLLDERTVLVADYADEKFGFAADAVERTFRCTRGQVARAAWTECAEGDPHYPARARLIPEAGGDAPLALSWADADAQLAVLFPDAEIKPLPPQPWSLRQHVDEVARLFEGWGFRVVRVPHPAPYLTIERHVYVGPEGGVARRVVRADPVFPTYTNALLVNGRAWVPRYATATPAQNSAAARVYASFGFEVESVDMTEDIAFRGATRCLALEIHGPPAGPA